MKFVSEEDLELSNTEYEIVKVLGVGYRHKETGNFARRRKEKIYVYGYSAGPREFIYEDTRKDFEMVIFLELKDDLILEMLRHRFAEYTDKFTDTESVDRLNGKKFRISSNGKQGAEKRYWVQRSLSEEEKKNLIPFIDDNFILSLKDYETPTR